MLYFPTVASSITAPRWAVDREAYEEGQPTINPSHVKPDAIVVKLCHPVLPSVGTLPTLQFRDYLWVECKAAVKDNPSGWREIIHEATMRLQIAHPNRALFLIFAVGWKCIPLLWSPAISIPQPPLWIQSSTSHEIWPLDPRIKMGLVGDWVNATSGQIITENAMSLDCFTVVPNAEGFLQIHNFVALKAIETLLLSIQDSALDGFNPERL
jgi:hypothetical protein